MITLLSAIGIVLLAAVLWVRKDIEVMIRKWKHDREKNN